MLALAFLLHGACSTQTREVARHDAGSSADEGGSPQGLDAAPAEPEGDARADGDDGSDGTDAATDSAAGDTDTDSGASSARDVFGVTELFPTAVGGLEWDSRYWDGEAHAVDFGTPDPADPLALANRRGDGEVTVNGDGTLRMTGAQPRLYLGTASNHPWLNVEITAYYQRIEDDDTAYAGLVVGARSGPNGHGSDNCTATTYYARFRNDGNADVEKELEHPAADTRATTALWDGADPPYGSWIGMKFIVNNVDGGQHVRLRVLRDLTEGADGGTWEPIIDYTDEGGWAPAHACGYAPDFIVTEGGGVVLVRNTGVTGAGALYKWLTVREVAPGD
jgi:hypothetical protein